MIKKLKGNQGYVLISTLFFLLLSGLFSHSIIQLSSNYLLQLRQVSSAYEAKAALNMSASLLQKEFKEGKHPSEGNIRTSAGQVHITSVEQAEQINYTLQLTKGNGEIFEKEVSLALPEIEIETETEEEMTVP